MARQNMEWTTLLGEVTALIRTNKFLTNKVNVLVETVGTNPNWDVIGEITYESLFNFHYNGNTKNSLKKVVIKAINNIIAKDRAMKNYKEVTEEELHDAVYEEFPF
jgi:hypothetical protein